MSVIALSILLAVAAVHALHASKDRFYSRYISAPGATWERLSAQTRVATTTLKRHYARTEREGARDAEELKRIVPKPDVAKTKEGTGAA